jgi:hypothetical protein
VSRRYCRSAFGRWSLQLVIRSRSVRRD